MSREAGAKDVFICYGASAKTNVSCVVFATGSSQYINPESDGLGAVRVSCGNPRCPESPYMHSACFETIEDASIQCACGQGPLRRDLDLNDQNQNPGSGSSGRRRRKKSRTLSGKQTTTVTIGLPMLGQSTVSAAGTMSQVCSYTRDMLSYIRMLHI